MARAGAVLGLAGAAFAALGLAFVHRARAQGSDRVRARPSPTPTPSPTPPHSWRDILRRPDPLYPSGVPVSDADYSPAFWQPTVHRLIAGEFPRVNEAFAMKWLTIESGGNPCAVGNPGQLGQGSDQPAEIGLGQLYNPDDFVHLHAPPAASFRAYAPAAAPLAAQYRQAIGTGDSATARHVALEIQSRTRPLTPDEVDAQVRWTLLAKIADDMTTADHAVARYSLSHWSLPDYWKLVKAPHALPGILDQGLPAVVQKLGRAPVSWAEFRSVLGMEGNAQWKRALDACEVCGNAVAQAVA